MKSCTAPVKATPTTPVNPFPWVFWMQLPTTPSPHGAALPQVWAQEMQEHLEVQTTVATKDLQEYFSTE